MQDAFGLCSDVTGVVQWQRGFLQREAVDVAVEQGYRVRGHRQGETRGAEECDHVSWCFRFAVPGVVREPMRLMAQGCRASTLRVDSAHLCIPVCHSSPAAGRSISLKTMSRSYPIGQVSTEAVASSSLSITDGAHHCWLGSSRLDCWRRLCRSLRYTWWV